MGYILAESHDHRNWVKSTAGATVVLEKRSRALTGEVGLLKSIGLKMFDDIDFSSCSDRIGEYW